MDKIFFIKLCFGVYQVTELFPKEEPLKFRMRERANKILADLISLPGSSNNHVFKDVLKDIEVLEGYFDLAGGLNWVDSRNFLVLRKEYAKIEIQLKEKESLTHDVKQEEVKKIDVYPRQKKILEVLKKQPSSQMRDIHQIFPKISKRTLQRDMDILLSKNLIKRQGKNKEVSYFLNATSL